MQTNRQFRALVLGLAMIGLAASAARACDLCAIYNALEARDLRGGFYLGLYEQLTRFGTLREEGRKIADDGGQYVDSSTTQLILGYQLDERLGVQANIPYIHRSYFRPRDEEGTFERGSESGLGDLALLLQYRAVESFAGNRVTLWSLLAGVKLPTGNSDRLLEEAQEGHAHGEEAGNPADELEHSPAVPSGIHGHDLALGSGSVDGILGTSAYLGYRRFFVRAQVQYALRSGGDHGYRYADDLTWSVAPGVFLWLGHEGTLSLALQVSGETKGEDELRGQKAEDTAITALYAGPSLDLHYGEHLYSDLALDLPLRQDNSSIQVVPDYRWRWGLSWRF